MSTRGQIAILAILLMCENAEHSILSKPKYKLPQQPLPPVRVGNISLFPCTKKCSRDKPCICQSPSQVVVPPIISLISDIEHQKQYWRKIRPRKFPSIIFAKFPPKECPPPVEQDDDNACHQAKPYAWRLPYRAIRIQWRITIEFGNVTVGGPVFFKSSSKLVQFNPYVGTEVNTFS